MSNDDFYIRIRECHEYT
jgi:hypothetical protein